jgi:hypothetical protein
MRFDDSVKPALQRALAALALATSSSSPGAPALPPYPDVWQAVFPEKSDSRLTALSAYLLDTGEVVFAADYESAQQVKRRELLTMFGTKEVDRDRSVLGTGQVTFKDGTVAHVKAQDQSQVVLADGRKVAIQSQVYRLCYRGPARQLVARYDQGAGETATRVVIFYLLPRPTTFSGGGGHEWLGQADESCPNEPPLNLHVPVESVAGSFLALPDDSVILLDQEHSLALRLTGDLTTRAPLLQRSLFIFPYRSDDDPLFVGKLTHKDYGSIEEGTAQYQKALDDLRDYLIDAKRKN